MHNPRVAYGPPVFFMQPASILYVAHKCSLLVCGPPLFFVWPAKVLYVTHRTQAVRDTLIRVKCGLMHNFNDSQHTCRYNINSHKYSVRPADNAAMQPHESLHITGLRNSALFLSPLAKKSCKHVPVSFLMFVCPFVDDRSSSAKLILMKFDIRGFH